MLQAVAFDCDGVLADNQSSWQSIHEHFGTENNETLDLFLDGKISEEEFVEEDIRKWREVQSEIHRDDIMRCFGGLKLMEGAREVVEELQSRGVYIAIISSGVDLCVGAIASMLNVDDWVANGFEWDEDGWLLGGLPTRVLSHEKGLMVEKLVRINGFSPSGLVSVGDSGTDISMMIEGSSFIGFNPIRSKSRRAFEKAGVPIVSGEDLRGIWPLLFSGESGPKLQRSQ